MRNSHGVCARCCLGGVALALLLLSPATGSHALTAGPPDAPGMGDPSGQMPEGDRLAEPVLPESPTTVDMGRNLYYFHCMPCHGDRGQGLTDEWREVWVEDHQNCWGRGCHAGRSELDAFYIPRTIPAVIGPPQALGAFDTAEELFVFLRATQPPQRAGALSDAEYWALTDFLLHENGRPISVGSSGLAASGRPLPASGLALALSAPLLALLTVTQLARRRAGAAS